MGSPSRGIANGSIVRNVYPRMSPVHALRTTPRNGKPLEAGDPHGGAIRIGYSIGYTQQIGGVSRGWGRETLMDRTRGGVSYGFGTRS